jgi:hypothetical protein
MSERTLVFSDETVDRRTEARGNQYAMDELIESDVARFLLLREGRVKIRSEIPIQLAWFEKEQISGAAFKGAETVFFWHGWGEAALCADPLGNSSNRRRSGVWYYSYGGLPGSFSSGNGVSAR